MTIKYLGFILPILLLSFISNGQDRGNLIGFWSITKSSNSLIWIRSKKHIDNQVFIFKDKLIKDKQRHYWFYSNNELTWWRTNKIPEKSLQFSVKLYKISRDTLVTSNIFCYDFR